MSIKPKKFYKQNKPSKESDFLINNRGLSYADGFFSTMGIYQGQILWFDHHIERLISHSQSLHLNLNLEAIIKKLRKTAQDIDEGTLKIIITRQPQTINGYGFINGEIEVFIKKKPISMPAYQGLNIIFDDIPLQKSGDAICLVSQISCLPAPLVGLKSLNRLDSVMVARELETAKTHYPHIVEGLVSDVTGNWIEGVMSNFFYQLREPNSHKENVWYTPPIDKSGVSGIMRAVIMSKLQDKKQPATERILTSEDLSNLASLFFCNAVRGIQPINQLYLPNDSVLSLNTTSCF